jgi:hypothetical protein
MAPESPSNRIRRPTGSECFTRSPRRVTIAASVEVSAHRHPSWPTDRVRAPLDPRPRTRPPCCHGNGRLTVEGQAFRSLTAATSAARRSPPSPWFTRLAVEPAMVTSRDNHRAGCGGSTEGRQSPRHTNGNQMMRRRPCRSERRPHRPPAGWAAIRRPPNERGSDEDRVERTTDRRLTPRPPLLRGAAVASRGG